jgi:predicted DNA-binding protein (MmcQ/YjbR family)
MTDFNAESVRDHCLTKAAVTESFPFDASTLVFKVAGKMFALCDIDHFTGVNLKCDPERAVDLRERYDGVEPGWHMSKVHWNTLRPGRDVPADLVRELIDHSYDLVVASLTRKARAEHGL